MTLRDPLTTLVDPQGLTRWGNVVLIGGFGLVLLLVVFGIARAPMLLWALAALPLLAGAALWLFRHPLVNLSVVLSGFVLILARNEGFSILEVLFGLYFVGFLAHWYGTRLLLYRERLAITLEEKALLILAAAVFITVPFAILYGAPPGLLVSELVALSTVAFYFPVREACVRYRYGIWVVVAAVIFIGLYAAARNAYLLRLGLSNAEFAWQIATGRVATNDYILMALSLLTLNLTIFATTRRQVLIMLPLFLVIFGGLLITQSRGFWLTFGLSGLVMLIIVKRQYKVRLMVLGISGLLTVLGLGMLLLGDVFTIFLSGLVNRIFSVETAVTADLSLVNRWYETAAVWEYIKANPILGYGPAINYIFFDLTRSTTDVDSFVHNGYVQTWYKFGIVGLAALVVFLLGTMRRGFKLFRQADVPDLPHVIGLAVGLIIVGTLPATITNNPFYLIDSLFMIGVLTGLGAGAHQRALLQQR